MPVIAHSHADDIVMFVVLCLVALGLALAARGLGGGGGDQW